MTSAPSDGRVTTSEFLSDQPTKVGWHCVVGEHQHETCSSAEYIRSDKTPILAGHLFLQDTPITVLETKGKGDPRIWYCFVPEHKNLICSSMGITKTADLDLATEADKGHVWRLAAPRSEAEDLEKGTLPPAFVPLHMADKAWQNNMERDEQESRSSKIDPVWIDAIDALSATVTKDPKDQEKDADLGEYDDNFRGEELVAGTGVLVEASIATKSAMGNYLVNIENSTGDVIQVLIPIDRITHLLRVPIPKEPRRSVLLRSNTNGTVQVWRYVNRADSREGWLPVDVDSHDQTQTFLTWEVLYKHHAPFDVFFNQERIL